jgi:hypothetical protein
LSQADRDIMSSRGWDPENASLATRYQELREKVDASRITENDLNYEMKKHDNQELVKENANTRPERGSEGNSRSELEKDNRIRELAERFATDQKAPDQERDREQER